LIPLISSRRAREDVLYAIFKRLLDAGVTLTGTVITLLLVHPIGCTDCAWRRPPAAVLVPSFLAAFSEFSDSTAVHFAIQ
jgi:hypothetical protein